MGSSTTARYALAGLRSTLDEHEVTPPEGSPTSLHLPGPDPLRVLLLGDGPAVGYTVASHDLALAGHLARTVASVVPRGVIVDIRADPRMTPADAVGLTSRIGLERYDAIVVTLGSHDAIRRTPTKSWGRGMTALVDHLDDLTHGRAPIAIGSIPELFTLRSAPVPQRAGVRTHADMLNLTLATMPLPVSARTVDLRSPIGRYPESPAERRQRWARDLVSGLGPLDSISPHAESATTRAGERRRQESLRRTGVIDAPCPRAIDDIVGAVQRNFGAPVAALNFIDDDKLYVKSARGIAMEAVPRTESMCDHTIRASRTLVVEDATADPRFRGVPFVHEPDGMPFYAGHPVESPDGERVGSLCLLDRRGRQFTDDDAIVLQELAFRVQNELYAIA